MSSDDTFSRCLVSSFDSCYMYDFGSRSPRRGVPRSIFLGIEFVKWSLSYLWFGHDSELVPTRVDVRGKNLVKFWNEEVMRSKVEKTTKARLRYYKPFAAEAGVDRIKLYGVYGRASKIDGRRSEHVAIARNWHSEQEIGAGQLTDREHRFAVWLREHRLQVFDSSTSADELREIQSWMVNAGHEESKALNMPGHDV